MGFHVDMDELIKLKKTYLDSAEETEKSLEDAKNSMNGIITSNSMYGEVGKSINNEINNSHNAIIVGLKNAYTIMDADYTQALVSFQEGVGETSPNAILDEEVMTQTKTKLTNANTKHSEYETNISQIYTDINDLISLSSPSSKVSTSITKASKVLSDAITKVNSFESAQAQLNIDPILTALASQIEAGNSIQGLSYTDPNFVDLVAHSQLAEGIKKIDDQITQAKKEQAEAARKAKEEEEEWRKNHPIQAWLKDTREAIGNWWEDVKKATKDIDIPVVRETLLVVEGVVGGAGNLVGDVAYLAVDLIQFAEEARLVAIEKLTGLDVAPDWVEKDVDGAIKNVKNVGEFLQKNLTLENGKKVLDYSWNLLTDERTRAQAWRDTQRAVGHAWNEFSKDGWYNTGGVIFEVGSWFIGAGELKAGLTAAKGAKTFIEGVRIFGSTVGRQALKNADDMGRSLLHLATRGPKKTKAAAKSVMNFIADPKATLSRWGDEIGEGASKLRSAASKFGDNLAEVSPSYNAFRESFQKTISNMKDNIAYAGAHFSDDFTKSGARVYNASDDVARGMKEAAEQVGKKASKEFRQEASEQLAKYSDEVAKGVKETAEQAGKEVTQEFGKEASEQLAKHSDEVARGVKETAEQAGKEVTQEFGQEASEQLAKHSDDVARGMKEAAEQAGKKARQEFSEEAREQLAKHSDDVAKGLEETSEEFSKNVAEEFVDGKFTDPDVQARYEKYLKKKAKQGKTPREPLDWKEASDRMAKIRNQGRQYELEKLEEFKEIARDVEEQVTIKVVDSEGNIVRTRVDAIGYDKKTGELLIREFKSSKMAPLTDNQTAAFEMIGKGADARVVGKGKGIFKGGFEIPAYTEIRVIRPD